MEHCQHVAIIMDGNGRWAQNRSKPRIFGHEKGAETTERIIYAAEDLGLKYLSLFAFSKENWKRPQDEVSFLLKLLSQFLMTKIDRIWERNIRLVVSGDPEEFEGGIRQRLRDVVEKTKSRDGMVVNLVLNYSGRWDIVEACRRIVAQGISPERIDEECFGSYLQSAFIPPPDLLIRTGGEMRLSNFFLWQAAYSEFYWSPKMWPEFTDADFAEAVAEFQQRERRFGGLTAQH